MSARPATSTRTTGSPLIQVAAGALGLEQACVCVLSGGRSSERDVSLDSGRVIQAALARGARNDESDGRGPARVRTVEIQEDGRWRVGHETLSPGAALDVLGDVDVFFSALHGGEGEGGAIQGLFTCCDRAFTGSGVAACAASLDKVFGRRLLEAEGARVAPGRVVSRTDWRTDPAAVEQELGEVDEAGQRRRARRRAAIEHLTTAQATETVQQAVEAAIQRLILAYAPGATTSAVVRYLASPAEAILETASSEGVDLIVLASHGRSGMTRWMLGSVAEKITRSADIPVLIVPVRDEATASADSPT